MKYFMVKKDTFMWDKGAILKNTNDGSGGGYKAISDLWDAIELNDEYISAHIIEKNPDWFERVYEVSILGKSQYLVKTAAKELYGKLHKTK